MQGSRLALDLDDVIERAREDLLTLRRARLFITGGTGFVGRWLLESILRANERMSLEIQVVVLSRTPDAFRLRAPHFERPTFDFVRGDVRALPKSLGSFDGIIHAATPASADLNRDKPLEMLDTIIDGGRAALELARASGGIPFLFTSSGAVYGKQPNDVALLDEGYSGGPDPLFAGNAYHEGKRISELHCGLYAAKWGIRAKIARLFAFVGPFLPLDRHLAIGNFIRDGLQGGPIVLSGDGTTVRSYLYAADMIVWLWAIYARGMPGRSYNVGSEESIDLRTLAALVAGRFPKAPEVRVSQVAEKGRSLDRYVPSTLRIRRELGVEQSVPLTDAVDRTIEFYRAG